MSIGVGVVNQYMTCPNVVEERSTGGARVKFDPKKRTLQSRSSGLLVQAGSGEVEFPGMELIGATNPKVGQGVALARLIMDKGTAAIGVVGWGRLPLICDYVSMEELENAEGVEVAAFEASKKLGW